MYDPVDLLPAEIWASIFTIGLSADDIAEPNWDGGDIIDVLFAMDMRLTCVGFNTILTDVAGLPLLSTTGMDEEQSWHYRLAQFLPVIMSGRMKTEQVFQRLQHSPQLLVNHNDLVSFFIEAKQWSLLKDYIVTLDRNQHASVHFQLNCVWTRVDNEDFPALSDWMNERFPPPANLDVLITRHILTSTLHTISIVQYDYKGGGYTDSGTLNSVLATLVKSLRPTSPLLIIHTDAPTSSLPITRNTLALAFTTLYGGEFRNTDFPFLRIDFIRD